MAEILEPVTFSPEIEGPVNDLIVPEEFIKDFHFLSDTELLIVMRITGPDMEKAVKFFKDSKGNKFTIKTTGSNGKQISDKFTLIDMEEDEGPYPTADIDIEPQEVKLILEFEKE